MSKKLTVLSLTTDEGKCGTKIEKGHLYEVIKEDDNHYFVKGASGKAFGFFKESFIVVKNYPEATDRLVDLVYSNGDVHDNTVMVYTNAPADKIQETINLLSGTDGLSSQTIGLILNKMGYIFRLQDYSEECYSINLGGKEE